MHVHASSATALARGGTPSPEGVVSIDGESFSELPSAPGWDVLWNQDRDRGRDGVMDEALRAELLEMERVDRAVRADLVARGELHRPGYHPQMAAVHRRHNARMRAIINAHGWPGYSLVGAASRARDPELGGLASAPGGQWSSALPVRRAWLGGCRPGVQTGGGYQCARAHRATTAARRSAVTGLAT
jgi:hypothetical protein